MITPPILSFQKETLVPGDSHTGFMLRRDTGPPTHPPSFRRFPERFLRGIPDVESNSCFWNTMIWPLAVIPKGCYLNDEANMMTTHCGITERVIFRNHREKGIGRTWASPYKFPANACNPTQLHPRHGGSICNVSESLGCPRRF